MTLLSVNGQAVGATDVEVVSANSVTHAEVRTPAGKRIELQTAEDPTGRTPTRESLWALGALFALLGAAVVVRRPDLAAARLFWLFAGSAALGLAAAPNAAGVGTWWARIAEMTAVVGLGASFVLLALALTREDGGYPGLGVLGGWGVLGIGLLAAYVVSLFSEPFVYQWVRPAVILYVVSSLIVGMVILGVAAVRGESAAQRQQTRVVLWGVALGTAPFVSLSLVPNALGAGTLLPFHVVILPVVLVPLSFAYAIVQYRMMEIRRLVHRGMVYGTVFVVLLSVLGAAVGILTRTMDLGADGTYSQAVVMGLVAAGIMLFFPLHALARRLVDRLAYGGPTDYRAALGMLGRDLWAADAKAQAAAIVHHVVRVLQLESGLLVLEGAAEKDGPVAEAGERSKDIWTRVHPQLADEIRRLRDSGVVEVRWRSEVFLVASLTADGKYLGYLLLGPKHGGEVFVPEERELVGTIAPVLALAIDKSELAQELRALNWRLVKAEETERARMAGDLHDGPLQKVILLTGMAGVNGAERRELAQQAVLELREICTRLRPSILDDLGLVAALEWLTGQVSKQSSLSVSLDLHHVGYDDRFAPDVEVALFRVAQESLNNAVKHSKGASVQVRLSKDRESLTLYVEDDGVGFPEASRLRRGFGLSGMRERMTQVGGVLDLQSAPGLGTRVIARVPASAVFQKQGNTP